MNKTAHFPLLLLGIRGCGKTSVGQLLAQKYGLHVIDSDAYMQEIFLKSPREIYLSEGRAGFQEKEAQTLEAIFSHSQIPQLVSAGGGLCDNERALKAIPPSALRIFLDLPESVLIARMLEQKKRTGVFPSILNAGADAQANIAAFKKMYQDRHARYCALADIRLEFAQESIEEIAQRVMHAAQIRLDA